MEYEKTKFNIDKYLKLFLKRIWYWIVPTILFSIGSIFYTSLQPDVYESTCTLRVERPEALDRLVGVKGDSGVSSVYQVVRQKMLSWQSVIQIVKFLELDNDLPKDKGEGLQKLYSEISNNTRLYGVGRDLFNISYRGENPDLNFRIVDGLVTNFMEYSLKDATLNASVGIFEIVEPVRISYQPLKVAKLKMIGMGVIMGFGLGFGLVFVLDHMDRRFKSVEDVEKYLNIAALGVIPVILTNTEIKRRFRKKIVLSGSMAAFVIVTTMVCLVVEPVKKRVNTGFDKLIELVKE